MGLRCGIEIPPPPSGTAARPRWPRVWRPPIDGVAGGRVSQWVNVRAYSLWSDRTCPVEEPRVMSVTKFPLLAQKRGIRAVLPVQGEFCPDLREGAWSRESFVPVSVSLRKIGRVVSRRRPIGGRAVACEIGGEVSDQLLRGSWASSRRSWADLHRGSTRIRIGSASIR